MIVFQFILTLSYLVFRRECKMEPFIVGGKAAKIADFPYVAYLGIECVEKDAEEVESWVCGASIVNQNILLTAGHCLFGCTESSLIVVYVGHENILEGTMVTAHSFIIHEYYTHTWLTNDIGLVRLKAPLVFSESISRVAILKDPPYDEESKLAGWGLVEESPRKHAQILQYIEQYVWQKQECLDVLKRLPEGAFCAASKNGTEYAALGDSGSPLVVRGYIQIGLVSSKSAKHSLSVAVYTDIGHFYNWITKSMYEIMCQQT